MLNVRVCTSEEKKEASISFLHPSSSCQNWQKETDQPPLGQISRNGNLSIIIPSITADHCAVIACSNTNHFLPINSQSTKKRRMKQKVSAALGDLSVLSEVLEAAAGAEKKKAAAKSIPKGLGVGGVAARRKIMCALMLISQPTFCTLLSLRLCM